MSAGKLSPCGLSVNIKHTVPGLELQIEKVVIIKGEKERRQVQRRKTRRISSS